MLHNSIQKAHRYFSLTYQVHKKGFSGWPKVLQSANEVHDVLLIPDNQIWVFLTQLHQPL